MKHYKRGCLNCQAASLAIENQQIANETTLLLTTLLQTTLFNSKKNYTFAPQKYKIMNTDYVIPFVFGTKADGERFTDRKEETKALLQNFTHGVNTIIISPRRMGKTSLVERTINLIEDCDIKIAKFDAFGCRCEQDFVDALATAVMKATSNKWEEWIENAKTFLTRFVPKISVGPDPMNDFSVSLEYNRANHTTEDILQLPEIIAQEKGIRLLICIDEFQQIGEFADSLTFQKKLRSVWQLQSHVSYCLYGSKKHMMENIFLSHSHPFYRFGDIMYLKKISETDWVSFICQRFEATGKNISKDLAREICVTTDCYSAYVQQLAWFVWIQTDDTANEDCLNKAINRLLDANESLFINQTEKLSDFQMNFLHAIADGIHTSFSQQNVLSRYRIGTSANVSRLKKSLIEKDLIDTIAPNQVDFADPILCLWLKKRVWRQ